MKNICINYTLEEIEKCITDISSYSSLRTKDFNLSRKGSRHYSQINTRYEQNWLIQQYQEGLYSLS